MNQTGTSRLTFFIGFLVLCAPGPAMSQPATTVSPEAGSPLNVQYEAKTSTVAITATSVPLTSVLWAITEKTGVVFYLPRSMNPVVSYSAKKMPLERAITQLIGLPQNTAMVYEMRNAASEKESAVLTEVRVLGAATPISKTDASPADAAAAGSQSAPPQLSPEAMAARRAQKDASRAAKSSSNGRQQKGGRGGRGNSETNSGSSSQGGQSTQSPSGAPAQPSAPESGSGAAAGGGGRR